MRRRNVLLALLAVELSVGAVLYRGGWLSRAPQSLAPPPLPAVVAEPPTPSAPITRVTAVDVRRGDTLVRALTRQGIEREASAGIAAALAASGANLKKLSPRHTLEVTSTLDGRPVRTPANSCSFPTSVTRPRAKSSISPGRTSPKTWRSPSAPTSCCYSPTSCPPTAGTRRRSMERIERRSSSVRFRRRRHPRLA